MTSVLYTAFAADNSTKLKGNKWIFFEDGYYKVYNYSDEPIVVRRLDDYDYIEIDRKIVDNSSKNKLNKKPLKKDWQNIVKKLKEEKTKVKKVDNKDVLAQEISVEKELSGKMKSIKLKKVIDEKSSFMMPVIPDDFPAEFLSMYKNNKSYIASDRDLWSIDHSTNKLTKVSKEKSEKKTYTEIVNESIKLYGVNIVNWNSNLEKNKDNTKFAYISNKDNIETLNTGLYLFDTTTETETCLKLEKNTSYMTVGWLDDEHILCEKSSEKEDFYVVVDTKGHEDVLNLEGRAPFVYAVSNNIIAYAEELNSRNIRIVEYDGTSHPKIVAKLALNSETRLRMGSKGFNENNTKFCVLYTDEKNPLARYLAVLDLQLNTIKYIDSLPKNCDFILEFSWIEHDKLMLVCGEEKNKYIKHTTWICEMMEEENDKK